MTLSATRRRVLIIVVIFVLLAVALIVIRLLLAEPTSGPDQASTGQPAISLSGDGTPRTLLLQVVDDDGLAVANVLLGRRLDDRPAVALILPPTVVLPGAEPQPIQFTAASNDTLRARSGVQALLGVRVDASVELGRLALAALVDGSGGIPLDVSEPVFVRDDLGRVTTTVRPGARVLDGVTAATYALAVQPGETADARSKRFRHVLDRIVSALPDDSDAMAQLVLSLGSLAQSTVTNEEFVDLLLGISGGDGLRFAELPTVATRADIASVMARPSGPALVERLFPADRAGALSLTAPIVEVRQAGSSAAVMSWALDELARGGWTPVPTGLAPESSSSVVVATGDSELLSAATRLATALGLPRSAIRVDEDARPSSLLVLVGRDLPGL